MQWERVLLDIVAAFCEVTNYLEIAPQTSRNFTYRALTTCFHLLPQVKKLQVQDSRLSPYASLPISITTLIQTDERTIDNRIERITNIPPDQDGVVVGLLPAVRWQYKQRIVPFMLNVSIGNGTDPKHDHSGRPERPTTTTPKSGGGPAT